MPQKLNWTPHQDGRLRRLRLDGQSWAAIAASLGVSRNAAMERSRTIGALLQRQPPTVREDGQDPARAPLQAGHDVSWQAITVGTMLAGEPYPRQAPMGRVPSGVVGEMC